MGYTIWLQVTYIFLVEIARWNVPCVCRHSFCCWNLPFLPIRPTYGWHSPFLQVRLMKFPSFNPPFPRRFSKIFHLPLHELHENSIFFPCSPDFTRTAQWLCKICNCFPVIFQNPTAFPMIFQGPNPSSAAPPCSLGAAESWALRAASPHRGRRSVEAPSAESWRYSISILSICQKLGFSILQHDMIIWYHMCQS